MAGVRGGAVKGSGAGRPAGFTLARFAASLRNAWRGTAYAWARHPNFRVEACLAVLSLALALWLGVAPWLLLIGWTMVIGFELLNTALEQIVDLVSPERNELAGRAKDLAAAGVLVTALGAAVLTAASLLPPLLARLGVAG